jgi:hypothetical protein
MPPAATCLVLLGMLHLLARAQAQERLTIHPACDAEDELLDSLRWLHEVCSHEGAVFPDDKTPVPSAIETHGCARAARRVRGTCGGLLGSSPWFASRKQALDDAVASAADVSDAAPGTQHLADPGVKAIHSCGAAFDDGFAQFPAIGSGQSRVVIDVGPSRGRLRIDFDHLTLDKKDNDNLRIYSDADENEELRVILSGDLPLTEPIEVDASEVYVLLVSVGASTRTSLAATVSCVCEDSDSFTDDDGKGCSAYGGEGEKHLRCASLLPPADERARAACPAACGACDADPCDASPCQNGGTCARLGGDGATCATDGALTARTAAVHAECCDEPTEDCSSGQPSTCNAGCAALLVPYFQDCQEQLAKEPGGVLAAVRSVAQTCASTPRYECSCQQGWSGTNCEVCRRCLACGCAHSDMSH